MGKATGANNRITEERYNAIKAVCKTPADDERTMEKHNVSRSTCRQIRNTADYQEYCARVFRYRGYPKRRGGGAARGKPAVHQDPRTDTGNGAAMVAWIIVAICVIGLIILGVVK